MKPEEEVKRLYSEIEELLEMDELQEVIPALIFTPRKL